MRTYTEDQLDEKANLVLAYSSMQRLNSEALVLEFYLNGMVDSVDGLTSDDVINMTRIQWYMAQLSDKLSGRQRKLREEGKE